MIKKALLFTSLGAMISFSVLAAKQPITIGIVVPINVPAMTQIINGFETTLNKTYQGRVTYLVKNAEGDINIQRSIIQEFNNPNVNVVAPIGTAAAQMTISMIRNKPIVGIAADHLKEEAEKANNPNVTGVLSEVSPTERVNFIHNALPSLKKITMIYSPDDRIFKQEKEFVKVAEANHIYVQELMISELSDLYHVSGSIDKDTQAIFVLKDELVVSGINTLLKIAHTRNIPLIASDDASVANGATFALGVSEKQSGIDAAKIVAEILNGKKASEIPVKIMKEYFVFLNPQAAKKQGVDPRQIKNAAAKARYTVKTV